MGYTEGQILRHSWGYEQTNIDFFMIVKRKGDWLTLQKMTSKIVDDNSPAMTGHCVPGEIRTDVKPFRRKIHSYNGEERGCGIHRSYGWASLWDGKPSWFSYYG